MTSLPPIRSIRASNTRPLPAFRRFSMQSRTTILKQKRLAPSNLSMRASLKSWMMAATSTVFTKRARDKHGTKTCRGARRRFACSGSKLHYLSARDALERNHPLLQSDPSFQMVPVGSEAEGVSIAAGAALGGKVVASYMEETGV